MRRMNYYLFRKEKKQYGVYGICQEEKWSTQSKLQMQR